MLSKIKSFYLRIFIIITVLNFFYFFCFGTYFEDYEGIVSTLIQGTYTKPCNAWYDINNHIFIIKIYELLVNIASDYNVYGIILFTYNWLILSLSGLVLYRILRINLSNKSILLFVLLYSILFIDNFVNLCSTRQAFILITAILSFVESRKLEGRLTTSCEWVFLLLAILYATLIRFEAVLLFSIIYIIIKVIYNTFVKTTIIPLIISGIVFLFFHVIIANYSSEPKNVFIYKEKQIFVRNDIDFGKLTKIESLNVKAIKQYAIIDKEHFTLKFYDSISKYKNKRGIFRIFEGLKWNSYKHTLIRSYNESRTFFYFFIFYLLSGIFLSIKIHPVQRRFRLYFLFLLLIPLFLCLNTVVPLRFLVPFFSIAGCFNIFLYIKYYKVDKQLFSYCFIILLLILFNVFTTKHNYLMESAKYNEVSNRLSLLDKEQHSLKPIIINNFFTQNYFPVEPLKKLPPKHALFLNFYFFAAWDYQIQSWSTLCSCNSFSLKEKIDYIVAHQNLFLIDNNSFYFLKHYMHEKYNLELYKINTRNFNSVEIVCKLKYM